jgi:hypothetical protein
MRRLLFATEATGGLGHILPWHQAAIRLIASGWQVYACSPKRLGFWPDGVICIENTLGEHADAKANTVAYSWGELLVHQGYGCPSDVDRRLLWWVNTVERLKIDAVVADYCPLGVIAASMLAVPALEVGNGYCVPEPSDVVWLPLPQHLLSRVDSAYSADAAVVGAMNHALKNLASSIKFTKLADLYALPKARCVVTDPFLDPYARLEQRLSSVTYLGPLAFSGGSRSGRRLSTAHGKPMLVCYLKADTPELVDLLTVLGEATHVTLVVAGLPEAPNFLKLFSKHPSVFFRKFLDLNEPLSLADAFFTNGGTHSLSWALRWKIPTWLAPAQMEQAATAFALTNHDSCTVCLTPASLQRQLGLLHKREPRVHEPFTFDAETKLLTLLDDF